MRHFRFIPTRVLAMLVLSLATGTTAAAEVWVITDSSHPVTGTRAPDRIIELDAPQRLEATLSDQLPNDPRQAAELVRQRLEHGGQGLQQRLHKTYQGVADAWSLGITTIPAVVVDRRYVIYGETSLDKALARVEQYREERP